MSCVIRCQNVSKNFKLHRALDEASFEINSGETVGLVGPNGAGKTTLLSILCGFMLPSSGAVSILNQKPGSTALLGQFSALPQDALFDPVFSVGKQLAHYAQLQGFCKKTAHTEVMRVLTLMQLQESANTKPTALSHGMRKRVAIAQALIGNPQLILLDEPTAGLDPPSARNIRQQISSLSGETTVLISSHNLQELENLCDRILHLDHGQLQPEIKNLQTQQKYLTLRAGSIPERDFIAAAKKIHGVISISNQQKNEFIICYEQHEAPLAGAPVDQQLLQLLAENDWQYHQLINGKTLEEQLFEGHKAS